MTNTDIVGVLVDVVATVTLVVTLIFTIHNSKKNDKLKRSNSRKLLELELKSVKEYIKDLNEEDIIGGKNLVNIRYIQGFQEILISAELDNAIMSDIYTIFDKIYDFNYYLETNRNYALTKLEELQREFIGDNYENILTSLGDNISKSSDHNKKVPLLRFYQKF